MELLLTSRENQNSNESDFKTDVEVILFDLLKCQVKRENPLCRRQDLFAWQELLELTTSGK
jgi:hypothetical protein